MLKPTQENEILWIYSCFRVLLTLSTDKGNHIEHNQEGNKNNNKEKNEETIEKMKKILIKF